LYDVQFFGNPFELMDQYPAHELFLGEEIMSKSSSKWMVRKCREMKVPLVREKYVPGTFIWNAGIIGGKRDNIVKLFKNIKRIFKNIPGKFNANMPVFNYCVDNSTDLIFTGHPLHNKFRSHKVPKGTYIKHK